MFQVPLLSSRNRNNNMNTRSRELPTSNSLQVTCKCGAAAVGDYHYSTVFSSSLVEVLLSLTNVSLSAGKREFAAHTSSSSRQIIFWRQR